MKMQTAEAEVDSSNGKRGKLSFSLEKESFEGALKIVENINLEIIEQGYESQFELGVAGALDTSKYLLRITDSKGNIYYDGLYLNRPSELDIPVGTYTISLRSGEFTEPTKNYPLFGDEQKIKALADSTLRVSLNSRQLTGGIRVSVSSNFIKYFKGTRLYFVKGDISHRQDYYGVSNYVFFYPGEVQVVYKNKDGSALYTPPTNPTWQDTVLLSRELKGTDLVSIDLDYDLSRANTGSFSVNVDTSRRRYSNYFNLGFFAPYGSVSPVYAKSHIGDTVRLWGYIVGTNATTSTFTKKAPFTTKTHIVVAKEEWQSLRENVMAVELPNGYIRSDLNLIDHPDLLKRKIVIDGVIVDSYFGHPGLKSVTSYKLY